MKLRRVKKVSGGVTTVYVCNAQGELAAEYGASTDSGTSYLTADHLGSTRLISDGHTVCKNESPGAAKVRWVTSDGAWY